MSVPLAEDVLTVSWKIPDPPIAASSWKIWSPSNDLESLSLESDLGWPSGTLAVLNQAFQQHLPRSQGWDLQQVTESAPYRQASRVFRRGVAVKNQTFLPREGHYPIILTHLWDPRQLFPSDGLVLIDRRVMEAWKITEEPHVISFQINESSKNLTTVSAILEIHRRLQSSYPGPWTIIGGGILADTAAFAAALVGQAFRLIPTTLLAMLDACVGGKTGVNFPPYGKNQVGLFAFPLEVVISTAWLQTLPQREFLAGLAEGFKHALLLGDPHLGAEVLQLDQRPQDLWISLKRLVQVKSDIVMQDPSERGPRAALNLGHTLAHALERVSHARRPAHPILHGEAVGVGLLFCLELSHSMGQLPLRSFQSMRTLLLQSRLLIKPRQLTKYLGYAELVNDELIEELLIGIKQDKKSRNNDGSEWVLLRDWGKIHQVGGQYTMSIFDDDFRTVYRKFVQNWLDTVKT